MQLINLKLTNFRNYPLQKFEFSKHKNIIIGNNGMGKTNIVEAIYYLAVTKSFRVPDDSNLIMENSEYAMVEGEIKDQFHNKYKVFFDKNGKKVFIDSNQVRKISDYMSRINIVLFNPEDLKLIKDSPSIHRKLINMEISQLDNEYLKLLSKYNKILKQRNTYLKSMLTNSMIPRDFLDILTNKLIEYGIAIFNLRLKFVNNINQFLSEVFLKITKKEGLLLKYISEYDGLTKDEIMNKYNSMFKKDLNYGKTNFGIHLDDFIFMFQEKLAKHFLSEGEQKNAVISFKLSEINVFYEKNNTMPILILDDLFSEIDADKINKIIKYFKKNIQIFITTTDLKNINSKILIKCNVYNLKNEKIEVKVYE